jgi:hypothetical protein
VITIRTGGATGIQEIAQVTGVPVVHRELKEVTEITIGSQGDLPVNPKTTRLTS